MLAAALPRACSDAKHDWLNQRYETPPTLAWGDPQSAPSQRASLRACQWRAKRSALWVRSFGASAGAARTAAYCSSNGPPSAYFSASSQPNDATSTL